MKNKQSQAQGELFTKSNVGGELRPTERATRWLPVCEICGVRASDHLAWHECDHTFRGAGSELFYPASVMRRG